MAGAARFAVIGIFVLLLVACLELARTLVLPIVSAAVVATMLGPLQRVAQAHRVPAGLFAVIALLASMAALNVATVMLSTLIADWLGKAGDITDTVKDKLQFLQGAVELAGRLQNALSPSGAADVKIDVTSLLTGFLQPLVGYLTPAIGEVIVFFAALFFLLTGRAQLRRLVLVFSRKETRVAALRVLNETEHSLTRYMAIVTTINLAVGLITGLGAYLLGLPTPPTWGALAFVLNFLPYIGPTIMVMVLFVAGLAALPTFGQAVLAPLLFVVLATTEGHFITPSIIGKRLTLTPLLVFLALIFWTWLWGPIGAFLSTPLLIIVTVVRDQLRAGDQVELP